MFSLRRYSYFKLHCAMSTMTVPKVKKCFISFLNIIVMHALKSYCNVYLDTNN